tara:strand:- start:431 stop:538 length:108 start_codon:yes stop_codon:yes gene_type:complete
VVAVEEDLQHQLLLLEVKMGAQVVVLVTMLLIVEL